MSIDVENFREEYSFSTLDIHQLANNPIVQFQSWLKFAVNEKVPEPNAMTLATVNHDGQPSARIVLLKGISDKGFVFYTNYNSQKSRELKDNSKAALVFFWQPLQRQVRIAGTVQRLDDQLSEKYFQSRPKASQIGAWASPQSSVIPDRTILKNKVAALEEQYKDAEVLPKPPHWGGFILEPSQIEFWQGRPSRLHDRFLYSKLESEDWKIERIAP